jgi:DNA mismatch repair protein MLH3
LGTELGVDSLIEHLNDVRERGEHAAERSPKAVARLLAEKACKGAKKFNQRLEPVKQQEVVSRLGECELPMHCAHGRPTSVPLVSLRSLQRKRARGRRQKRPTLRRAKKQIAEGGSATEAERWR